MMGPDTRTGLWEEAEASRRLLTKTEALKQQPELSSPQ